METFGDLVLDYVPRGAVSGCACAAVVPVSCGECVAAADGRQLPKRCISFGGNFVPFIFEPSILFRGSLSTDIITIVLIKRFSFVRASPLMRKSRDTTRCIVPVFICLFGFRPAAWNCSKHSISWTQQLLVYGLPRTHTYHT